MITAEMAPKLFGDEVLDRNGERIGKVGQVYLDTVSGQPAWATVKTGLFGLKESFVPLAQAQVHGDTLQVPITKDKIKDAPRVDAEARQMSEQDERELYRYYGLDYSTAGTARDGQQGRQQYGTQQGQRWPGQTGATGATGHTGQAGQTAQQAGRQAAPQQRGQEPVMTRSEERLKVGMEPVQAGQVRLRKYVVTEQQHLSVPVRHEQVRLEREPITDADRARTLSGEELVEDEYVETLYAERPVVRTEVTPVEQVRLTKDAVTEQQSVSGEVRKERIEVDDQSGLLADRTNRPRT